MGCVCVCGEGGGGGGGGVKPPNFLDSLYLQLCSVFLFENRHTLRNVHFET